MITLVPFLVLRLSYLFTIYLSVNTRGNILISLLPGILYAKIRNFVRLPLVRGLQCALSYSYTAPRALASNNLYNR